MLECVEEEWDGSCETTGFSSTVFLKNSIIGFPSSFSKILNVMWHL